MKAKIGSTNPARVYFSCSGAVSRFLLCCYLSLFFAVSGTFFAAAQKDRTQQRPLNSNAPTYVQVMNRLSQPYLIRREKVMASIHTRAQALERRAWVRATLLRLIGGLPNYHGSLNAKVLGTTQEDGYHIQRIIYDSLPGLHVTANLYLPSRGKWPFPAIVYNAGHGPWGKAGAAFYGPARDLARDGFAVLAYDPLGSGERLQTMNPATGKSWAGPDEHSEANVPMSLIGDNIARYMVWDAMRGIDYLQTRPDIDSHLIGSYGCSGGGTLSAYLAALDPRVKAAVVGCYITSWNALLHGIGPQDGEQVFPGFIKDGLDFGDLVELAAPRAYAIVSTTGGIFPFSGTTATYDEAERFYSLLGAPNHLQWFSGPGGHGHILPLMPKILGFFEHWLQNDDSDSPALVHLPVVHRQAIQCTASGQVTTSLPGRTIYQINRARAKALIPFRPTITTKAELAALQEHLRKEIPAVTGMSSVALSKIAVTVTSTEQLHGYRFETAIFHSLSGMDLPARIALPDKPGRLPAVLISSNQPIAKLTATGSEFEHAAQLGRVVLAMTPVPWPPDPNKRRVTLGRDLAYNERAWLIGKSLVGMRVRDMLAAVDWLAEQSEVDTSRIDAIGYGTSGVALLHAAVLDSRIHHITLEHTLCSYQSVIDVRVNRNIPQSVIPGVLLHYDLSDLMIAIAPRTIVDINPVDGAGARLSINGFIEQMARVFDADRALGLQHQLIFEKRSEGQ